MLANYLRIVQERIEAEKRGSGILAVAWFWRGTGSRTGRIADRHLNL